MCDNVGATPAKTQLAEARVQRLRVEALKALSTDVHSGAFPEEKHLLKMKDDEFDAFLKSLV